MRWSLWLSGNSSSHYKLSRWRNILVSLFKSSPHNASFTVVTSKMAHLLREIGSIHSSWIFSEAYCSPFCTWFFGNKYFLVVLLWVILFALLYWLIINSTPRYDGVSPVGIYVAKVFFENNMKNDISFRRRFDRIQTLLLTKALVSMYLGSFWWLKYYICPFSPLTQQLSGAKLLIRQGLWREAKRYKC